MFGSRLEEAGIFKSAGAGGTAPETSVRDMVEKAVRERLGRDPLSEEETAVVKSELYQTIDGLFARVSAEEIAEARGY